MNAQETLGSFLDEIARIVGNYPSPQFRFCSLETLTYKNEPLFCLIRAGVSNKSDVQLDYGKMRLERRMFNCDDLRGQLANFYANHRIQSGFGEIAFEQANLNPPQQFHNSGSPYHAWPGRLYILGATTHGTTGTNEPLVGKDLLPFFNAQDAVSNWIGIPINSSDSRFGRMQLFLPDFTARIGKMTFADSFLRIRADFAHEPLFISVLAKDEQTTVRKTKPLRKSQSFRLMADPTNVAIFITNDKKEIVDSFAEDENRTSRERVIFASSRYSDVTMTLIRRGETDTVEFKSFIRLDDMKKANELVKAVISFANTRGGTIFIGVTDDAEIVGIESQIPHKTTAANFEKGYFKRVRELLKQKLNRIPHSDMRTERLGDKSVFIIEVSEGTNKPYYDVQTREIFVRRGASDVRPDPDTELPRILGSNDLALRAFQ